MSVPSFAPNPGFPEKTPTYFEGDQAPAIPGNTGPHLFEEGLATDPDIPADFSLGIQQGETPAPGRPNRNANVFYKYPDETMKQRVHAGSASWVEAPTFLQEFVQGAFSEYVQPQWELEPGSEQRIVRPAPNIVRD